VATSATASSTQRRGRPPAASREQVLERALHHYLRGRRIDVQAIAAELGLGRATIYRWFGSREDLIGEVLVAASEPLLDAARANARGRGGNALLDTFDRFNRSLAGAPALRQFVENERDAALRIITSSGGRVQPRIVERITGLIEDEVRAGRYEPPVEPSTLGYAIVRLAEAFLFNDAIAGMRGDVDRLREVEAALLGVDRKGRGRRAQR
jgi:AcrR family transcriptional regulator